MASFKKYFFIIFIIVIASFALKSLWGPQFYTSHDGQSHLARLYQLDKVLKDGQFPPRWAGQFAGERGYPVFVFAYPLPYFVAEGFHLVGFNLAESVKLVFAFFYILSGIFMYLFVKEIFKSDWTALISAILWTWAPYRFVKIFVTASLGESVAFVFVPLIFLFIYQLVKKPNKASFMGFSLSLAALILTHLITLIIFLPLIICFLWWCLSLVKQRQKTNKIKILVFGSFLAFFLSAFYLIPAVWEIRYTRYKAVLVKNYYQQFVEPAKLLYSPWGYGVPKIGPNPLSLQIGVAQWLVVLISAFLIIRYISIHLIKKEKKKLFIAIIFFGNFLLSIFLMLNISKPIWDFLPPLQSVDTPWRFLSLSVFTTAFLGGWLTTFLKKGNLYITIIISSALLFLAFYGNRNHLRINASIDYPDKYFESYYWVGSGWDEYRPKWIKDSYHKPPKKKVEVLEGECQLDNYKQKSNLIGFNLHCRNNAKLLVNHAYYPGWKLFVDGSEETKTVVDNLEKSSGLMMFEIDKGNHLVKLVFSETPLRLTADILSLATFIILIFLLTSKKATFGKKK